MMNMKGPYIRKFIFLILVPHFLSAQIDNDISDVWIAFRPFIGVWEGTGNGRWGVSSVAREYDFVLNGAVLYGKNKSVYKPQEKNPYGEEHENWDLITYDTERNKYVLRQFDSEEIVNQYVADSLAIGNGTIEFYTEFVENFPGGWRAKESYTFLNTDEFIETFSLAAPGEEFKVFVENRFKRKRND